MDYLPKEINEKGIYVLKRESDSKPTTEFIDYNQSLSAITGYDNIIATLGNNAYSLEFKIEKVSKFIELIKRNHSYLLKYRNFCGKNALTSSFIRNPDVNESTEFSIHKSDSVNYHHIEFDSEKNHSYILESWIYDIFHGYYFEQAFENIKNRDEIKLYSHRKYSFNKQIFAISDDFSLRIVTNFGY